jgi:beta-lactam-binding protein with PASTA domain
LITALVLGSALAGCGGDNQVKVPDVTGFGALDARRTLQDVGLSVELEPEPALPTMCRVDDQSERGRVPAGTKVVLRLSCPKQR